MTSSMKKSLDAIAKWGKITGVFMIIGGGIYAFFGISLLIIGAAPGVLMIFSGIYLIKSANAAQKMSDDMTQEPHEALLDNYVKFMKWQFFFLLSIIVIFILCIVAFFFLIFLGILTDLHSGYDPYYYE
ncbi:DUF5362 family protein [Bacillus paralicheniformis]|uniref:DUF5362 family protein n=1 Tax=Bacillus paralicheniformis TaxID=1648923 RepID=UPI001E57ABB9|nr:DUF5362 family protein [Bacillus paralicheniformis]MCB6218526.1 DUF5362 domain-containing protein [Bacillus paralicheniformis]MCQ5454157.1 DUF5362 domain-containing protein [Bacillus paralicheniformis]MCU4670467.1 DUF5362 domain-containing protein [Bacillus paralicheniformis]MCU4670916.1 DUF5362 domain-containing protein [Bacillus paralicheniformis]MDW6055169.1 DUF5362 family protein [Bacillus paralicheniformis]